MAVSAKNKWKIAFVIGLAISSPYLLYLSTLISSNSICIYSGIYSSKNDKIIKAKEFIDKTGSDIVYNWHFSKINKGPPDLPALGFISFIRGRAYYIHVPTKKDLQGNPSVTHLSVDMCGNINGQGIEL